MTVEKVEKAIITLEGIDPNNEYAYEKAILAFLTIGHLPVLLYEIPKKAVFFRTRTHENDELFNFISDINITPKEYVRNFGRCNRPFQSKFYCSENRSTSFMELVDYWSENKKAGDKLFVTISRWISNTPLTGIMVTTPDKENKISDFDKEHGSAMEKFIANSNPEFRDATVLFYRFLFDKFRKPAKNDPKNYLITTAYCNVALSHSEGKADGFYYPSVPFGEQGVNFAINSDYINKNNIELAGVLRNELTISENENGMYTFTETGKKEASKFDFDTNEIVW
jgi:hypothetical protein